MVRSQARGTCYLGRAARGLGELHVRGAHRQEVWAEAPDGQLAEAGEDPRHRRPEQEELEVVVEVGLQPRQAEVVRDEVRGLHREDVEGGHQDSEGQGQLAADRARLKLIINIRVFSFFPKTECLNLEVLCKGA